MTTLEKALDQGGITTESIRNFVKEWAEITQPDRVEVISAADDARLIKEALEAGELLPVSEGCYYSRSHAKDTARSEERTVVATANEKDKGVYNNWKHSTAVKEMLVERMRGASENKTMYVVPYLMSVPGCPLQKYAAGVELTDNRVVVLQMIRMARVGIEHFSLLKDKDFFVRAVHVSGDIDKLGHGTETDQRLFATIADERMILHFGSAYGGNALLGKIAHGLRQASYDGWVSGEFLAEQFMLLGIVDKETGKTYHICGGFPSASGKTNLAMTLPPDALGDRYKVEFYGDDIAWMWIGEDGRLYGMNPENGVFGVAKDTNEKTNPAALDAIHPTSGAIFTNVAYNELTHEVWWEGKTSDYPTDLTGWRDWTGALLSEREPADLTKPWAHPNSRFTTALTNVTTVATDAFEAAGVPIDAIIFGGRARDREPLIRAITDYVEGIYDGLTLGAEATFAAEGLEGVLRYDPMSMRPFMSYSEGDYAQHWIDIMSRLKVLPIFAHVNWFQRDSQDGHFLWPGYRDNLRPLLWLRDFQAGEATGTQTPVGVIPTAEELDMTGLELPETDLERLLSFDTPRWQQEMTHRTKHLGQFATLPPEIQAVHEKITAELSN